ncbi:MAG: hypothetical protein E6H58_04780, partial [Betaproteobacteria bacterium]
MTLLHDALRAGHASPRPPRVAGRQVLVAGGGGALGAAVLEQLLASREFAQVTVLVTRPLNTALLGLRPLLWDAQAIASRGDEDTALIVFDRARHANRREQAYLRPDPAQLPALAAALRERGVRRLVVVLPHASASLPDALKHGLANLDEQAVASLGFEQLLFMRSAQARDSRRPDHPLQRVAQWMLSQLQLMVPQRDKPVRALKVAQFAVALAARLQHAPPGTRVVPPELVWDAAQAADIAA